jgi:hypothetical protein
VCHTIHVLSLAKKGQLVVVFCLHFSFTFSSFIKTKILYWKRLLVRMADWILCYFAMLHQLLGVFSVDRMTIKVKFKKWVMKHLQPVVRKHVICLRDSGNPWQLSIREYPVPGQNLTQFLPYISQTLHRCVDDCYCNFCDEVKLCLCGTGSLMDPLTMSQTIHEWL